MSDTAANRTFIWFTPWRFGILLALLIFAAFPQVILGLQTFVARDYGFFAYPLAHFQKECFWRGELPFWDPYNNCGVPFLAQWNTMPLYPPSLIYLLLPLTWSLSFFCLLHLWFGGWGMYFLARKWTGNDFAGAFAGTVFCFSGLTLNLLMWPSHTATWSWMPWVVLLVENAWGGRVTVQGDGQEAHGRTRDRQGGIFRAAGNPPSTAGGDARRYTSLAMAAMAGAFQMLAGGPEIIFFTWLILLVLWIQQLLKNGFPWRAFWRFPVIVGLVVALAAAQLLPFLHLAADSQRQAGYADLRWSMPGTGWTNFLLPMAFGTVRGEGIFFQNDQFWTSSYYLGMGTLWLALLAVWSARHRRVYLLAALAAVAVIFALGGHTPILPAIRRHFPQLGFVTYPVKYLLIVTFIAPLLAASSLSRLQPQNNRRPIAVIGTILFLLLGAAFAWASRHPDQPGDNHALLVNAGSRAVFLILTGIILIMLARGSKSEWFKAGMFALIFIAWLDVLTHEPAQNPTVAPNVYQPGLARAELAMQPQPELGGSRAMVSPKAYMDFIHMGLRDPKDNYLAKRLGYCGDCNLLDNVPKVDGFFSLTTRENNNLFSLLYGATNEFPQLEDFMGVSHITAPDEMYHWRSRKTFLPLLTAGQKPVFLDDADALAALANRNFDGSKTVILPPEAKKFVMVTNQTEARVVDSKFEASRVGIEVDAAMPSLVVIAQTYYDEWSARVDGRPVPILRANYGFQAVQVPSGKHAIELVYKDAAFETGAIISIAAWLACLPGCIRFRKPE